MHKLNPTLKAAILAAAAATLTVPPTLCASYSQTRQFSDLCRRVCNEEVPHIPDEPYTPVRALFDPTVLLSTNTATSTGTAT
jgi:hypothetical protein